MEIYLNFPFHCSCVVLFMVESVRIYFHFETYNSFTSKSAIVNSVSFIVYMHHTLQTPTISILSYN